MVASGILLVYGNYFLGNYSLICLDKRGWSSAPFSMRRPFGGGCIVKKFFFHRPLHRRLRRHRSHDVRSHGQGEGLGGCWSPKSQGRWENQADPGDFPWFIVGFSRKNLGFSSFIMDVLKKKAQLRPFLGYCVSSLTSSGSNHRAGWIASY